MAENLSEQLTARFYQWEERGRGWSEFPASIELEPEFYPFFGHYTKASNLTDDSRKPNIFNAVGDLFRSKPKPDTSLDYLVEIPPVRALQFECDESLIAYSIAFPKNEKIRIADMEQLLLMLSDAYYPVSFEIIATEKAITLQFTCRESDSMNVYGQIKAFFPAAIISQNADFDIFGATGQICASDFGLAEEFMRPLRMAGELSSDPFVGLFVLMEQLNRTERGVIQVLFKGTANPWAESVMRSVSDNKGGSFFQDSPEMVKLAQQKVSSPLLSVCIRVAGQAANAIRAVEIAKGVGHALMRLTASKNNQLVALPQSEYSIDDIIADISLRETHRLGMLLNSDELATLVHFPTPEIQSEKLIRDVRKTKAAPEYLQDNRFVLGVNSHHGEEHEVSLPTDVRLKHTHIIGATGTGKSTLLLSMISQDILNGNGLAVLDPHGDLIESILTYIPEERFNDVILIDPSDGEYPVGFNILSAHSEIEKDILSSDLVAAFRRLSTSWGDQMNSVFANAILAFLENKDGGTLVDLRRFLVEKSFRDNFLKKVSDPHVVYYWQHEYPLLKSSSIGSILTRLDTFLRPKLIRNMVAQKKGLDFENILDTKKILLIKLSQGLIGAENSFLLGTFFVSKMYQAAMARQAKSKESRSDYFLYIDEFQNFITPSMSYILSGARKYHLGLILAHQDMQQLQKFDTELASAVVVNAGTRICFRLGDVDARRFASGFSYFDSDDLENLNTGEAIVRIEQPNFDFNLNTIPLPEISSDVAESTTRAVISRSRQRYGTPKEEIEKSLDYLNTVIEDKVKEKEPEPVTVPKVPKQEPEEVQVPPVPFVPVEIPRAPKPAPKVETQHRYLQTLIKRMAESRGYKAAVEEVTPDGKGRVDVSLEKAGRKIACEISVTADDTWEIHNVEKCLAAGYDEVIVCSNDFKNIERIRKQINEKFNAKQQQKIMLLESQAVIQYFDRQLIQDIPTVKVVKGYRVKVEYDTSDTRKG